MLFDVLSKAVNWIILRVVRLTVFLYSFSLLYITGINVSILMWELKYMWGISYYTPMYYTYDM